jgi:hypothetical protein
MVFSVIAHEQTTRQDIRFDDQIHSRVVVLDTRDGSVLGAFGIDEPTVYERNPCAGEESELPTCRSRAERGGGGEDGIEIHALWERASESVDGCWLTASSTLRRGETHWWLEASSIALQTRPRLVL